MNRLLAVAAAVVLLAAGCSSIPPLEDWERFQVSCKRGETPDACIVTIKAKNMPPAPIGHVLQGEIQLVEGDAQVEIKGWRGPRAEGEAEGTLVATIKVRGANTSFKFALLDRGHRDEYTIVMPATGEPTIEPATGEFSERG